MIRSNTQRGASVGVVLALGLGSMAMPALAESPSSPAAAATAADAVSSVAATADETAGETAIDLENAGVEIIVVTGTRSESTRAASPVTTEVIDRQRLEESGVQTAAEALAQRPGVWIERSIAGTSGVSMQGLGAQYTLVLVDGARQIGRTDGTLDLDRFAVEDIEQIEIVRGPSSVLYGSDALGGVVNLVSRPPSDGIRLDALGRVDGRLGYEARARLAGGHKGYAGALVGTYREAPAITLDGDGTQIRTTFDAYEDAHVTGRGIAQPSESWRIDVAADYLQRDMRGVETSATGAVFDQRNVVEAAMGQVIARWSDERTAVRLEVDGSVYRDQYLSDQRMSDALDQYQVTDETLFEARAQVARQLGGHRVLVGGEVLDEHLETERLVEAGNRTRSAVFVQDEWRPGGSDRLLIVPAARYDYDTQFGSHATPRLAARWQVEERAVLRGSVGMGYRAPSFKDLLLRFENPGVGYVVEGNPELRPETSFSMQAGGEWQPKGWLWLGADAYVNRLRDMIFAVTLPADGSGMIRYGYDNLGRVRTMGFEMHAALVKGRAGLELGYAFSHSRDLDAERALQDIPRHRFTATARWRDKADGFQAIATAVVTGRRPYYLSDDPLDVTWTKRRVEVRARVSKRLSSGLGGFLGVDNLLGAGDAQLDRILPRTFYAGLELHLDKE